MTYQEADAILRGWHDARRRPALVARNTYLVRRDTGMGRQLRRAIAVRFHSTDVLTLYPSGKVRVSTGGYGTVTTKARINHFIPRGRVWTEAGKYGAGNVVLACGGAARILDPGITIYPNGRLTGGRDAAKVSDACRQARNAAGRARYAARYWTRAARGVLKHPRMPALAEIQAEGNISNRTSMIKVYGLARFLADVGAKALDTAHGYDLLGYTAGDGWSATQIRALRMVCPSTGTVYIHPIDPSCSTVSAALDWMFQTEGYLARLNAEA